MLCITHEFYNTTPPPLLPPKKKVKDRSMIISGFCLFLQTVVVVKSQLNIGKTCIPFNFSFLGLYASLKSLTTVINHNPVLNLLMLRILKRDLPPFDASDLKCMAVSSLRSLCFLVYILCV